MGDILIPAVGKIQSVCQTGEPGQTAKLTFVSLIHQIDSGLKRDNNESEIVDTVLCAIFPHSSLRSYVEILSDFSLAKLRRNSPVCTTESLSATTQQFILRALDLRNQVDFASQESDCELHYRRALIQKTFVKSFETGLRDDILACNLRPTLRTARLTKTS